MARSTRQFIDLDAAFSYNPRTRDVATKTDDNAIRGALRNLIHTKNYERPFQPDLGSQLHSLLFDNLDDFSVTVAERVLADSIRKYEPRIDVFRVQVVPNDANEMYIQVEYKIKNTQTPAVFTTSFTRVR
jgi:phage baseplate assembly protein W